MYILIRNLLLETGNGNAKGKSLGKQTTGRAPVGKPSTSKLVWTNPQRLGEDFPISLQRKYWVIEFLFRALSSKYL